MMLESYRYTILNLKYKMGIIVNNLIVNSINHIKNRCTRVKNVGNNQIEISYYLSIPAWIDDTELIKDENCYVVYAANNKKKINKFIVDYKLVNSGKLAAYYYPQVSNNKFFVINKNIVLLIG